MFYIVMTFKKKAIKKAYNNEKLKEETLHRWYAYYNITLFFN